MELRDGTAVLMNGSGEIRALPARPEWRVGDTVEIRRRGRPGRWAALAAALLLVIGGGAFGTAYFTAYSLVSLDVNPSVELTLNRFDRVIAATARNDEGAELLSLSDVENLTAEQALETLLGGDCLADYLDGGAYVTLTVQSGSGDREQALLALMDRTVEAEICVNYQNARVDCIPVDETVVAAAHACGVTAGKYLALLELRAADPEADISAYAHCGIGEIKSEAQERRQASCDGADGSEPGTVSGGDGCGYGDNADNSGGGRHHHGGDHE